MRIQTTFIILFCLLIVVTNVAARGKVLVAVAANFAPTLQNLAQQYEHKTHTRIKISFGSTGTLYAKIMHGIPYDIFFSADAKRPKLLQKAGKIIKGSRFTYAIGKLVLWAPHKKLPRDVQRWLAHAQFKYLALANPHIAPYGLAAQQVLKNFGYWQAWTDRFVFGENVAQTFNFIVTGNAQLGFVALSQVLYNKRHCLKCSLQSVWIVPQNLYSPITQQAVLLLHAKHNVAAYRFLKFIKSKTARMLIKQAGYAAPKTIKH